MNQLQSLKQNKGNAAAIFSLKKRIVGTKSASDEPSVILDPKTNIPIFEPSKIKEVCVEYCKDLLTNREPNEDFVEDLQWKRRVHNTRMEERLESDVEYSEDMFRETLRIHT